MLHPGLTPLPGVPFQKNHVSPSPFLGVCFPATQAKTPSLRIWDGWGSALFLLPNFKLLQRGANSQFTEDSCFPYKRKETPVGTSSPSAFQEHVVRVCLGRSDRVVSKTAHTSALCPSPDEPPTPAPFPGVSERVEGVAAQTLQQLQRCSGVKSQLSESLEPASLRRAPSLCRENHVFRTASLSH